MSAPTSLTNSPCHSAFEWRKRTRSITDTDDKITKRSRYYYILASESSSNSDDGTESVYSVQDKETDYAKDTSDTDTKSEMSDYDIQVEYDVVSTSEEEENLFFDGSSSDNDDAIVVAGVVAASICEEERSRDTWLTDGEDDTDSIDSDIDSQLQDRQKCSMCKIRERLSCFPFCSHCHQIRKTFFPPRPRKHKQKKSELSQSSQVTTDSLRSCLNGLSTQESGIGSSQELQPLAWEKVIVPESLISRSADTTTTLIENLLDGDLTKILSEKNCTDSLGMVQRSNESKAGSSKNLDMTTSIESLLDKTLDVTKSLSSESTNNEPIAGNNISFEDKWSEWALATKEMCIMCNERPKNGIFLHSTGAHLCCCYTCAVKYWSKSKRCAYCNRKVKNVVKAFIV